MTKGKTHYRGARCDIVRLNAANLRRQKRQQERAARKTYDQRAYDGAEGAGGQDTIQ